MATTVLESLSPLVPESRTTQAILIGAAVALVVYFITRKRYKYPPGPRGLPLLGSLLELRKSNLVEKMPKWEKEYGPIVTVNLGPMRTVILNSLDIIQEAYVKKSIEFAGRPHLHSFFTVTEGGKDIATTTYGPTWQLHRRLALRALNTYLKGSVFEEALDDVLQMAFEEMRKEKGPFDIKTYTGLIVFNLINNVCFSEIFPKGDKTLEWLSQHFEETGKAFGNGFLEDIFPPLRLYPTRKFRNLVAIFDERLEYIYQRINKHKETFSPDTQRDFTDAILNAQKELTAEESPETMAEITDAHFAQTISDIFGAGIDTSRQTLYWTILYIAAHPEVQAKIHEEVDSVLGARRSPLMSHRNKLPYTEAALGEAMRIATITPFAAPHTTTCDTSLCGYDIPKGTFVLANLYGVHHDPKLFADPWKYKPERFLDSNGRYKKPEGWMPFSVGRRACLAESLAKPELHMIVAALYRNFEICLPKGVKADFEPEPDRGMVYVPNPYNVVIKDRFA